MGETIDQPVNTAEMNQMIEANLPLVKHIVLQVAVHFPRHVEREELARAGLLVSSRPHAASTRAVGFRSTDLPHSEFVAQSSTQFVPPTGHHVRSGRWHASSSRPSSGSQVASAECHPPKRWPKH